MSNIPIAEDYAAIAVSLRALEGAAKQSGPAEPQHHFWCEHCGKGFGFSAIHLMRLPGWQNEWVHIDCGLLARDLRPEKKL